MSAYKHMRCKVNNLNQSLKTQYFTNKLRSCEGNIKETWKTMNQVINKRSKTTNIKALKEGAVLQNSGHSVWSNIFLQLLLYGDQSLSYEANRSILTLTITYILKTERLD